MKWFIAVMAVALIAVGGFAYNLAKNRQSVENSASVDSREHVPGFEQAVNSGDLAGAAKFLDAKASVVLYGSECCGVIDHKMIMQYVSTVKPPFTFDRNSVLVQQYLNRVSERNKAPAEEVAFRLTPADATKLGDFVLGVNSSLDAINYIAVNGKVTYILIDKGMGHASNAGEECGVTFEYADGYGVNTSYGHGAKGACLIIIGLPGSATSTVRINVFGAADYDGLPGLMKSLAGPFIRQFADGVDIYTSVRVQGVYFAFAAGANHLVYATSESRELLATIWKTIKVE